MVFNLIKQSFITGIFLLGLIGIHAQAQNYPNKPIKIVVGFSPGGGPDISARVIGQKMTEKWGQSVIVENRPGAGSNIATQVVASAKPDGYTLLSVSNAFAIAPAIYSKLPFDTLKDLEGITLTATGSALVLISPNLKINSMSELIALAKKDPGKYSYSSAGIGSGSHFAVEILKAKTGTDFLHVPTKGIPEGITEVLSGRVDFFISPYASAINMVRDGRAKAIAITSLKRAKEFPNLPTVAETVPGYKWEFWYGLIAPRHTPKEILEQIALEVKSVNEFPEVRERYANLGLEPASTTPTEFDKMIKSEVNEFIKIAKAAKITAE
jgi:tripartite-type tricarboxylate transporter receptor subunit TctC